MRRGGGLEWKHALVFVAPNMLDPFYMTDWPLSMLEPHFLAHGSKHAGPFYMTAWPLSMLEPHFLAHGSKHAGPFYRTDWPLSMLEPIHTGTLTY